MPKKIKKPLLHAYSESAPPSSEMGPQAKLRQKWRFLLLRRREGGREEGEWGMGRGLKGGKRGREREGAILFFERVT